MITKQKTIQLFAGPGSGKSTGAAYIFARLKMLGVNCELVSEYAKDKVWEGTKAVFENQLYITGKQSYRMSRLRGKVEVIITDSPILMAQIYAKGFPYEKAWCEVLKTVHAEYNNFNVFVHRVKPYNPYGRFQTEKDAIKLDKQIQKLIELSLEGTGGSLHFCNGDINGYEKIVKDWCSYNSIPYVGIK
jgi:hypothetical protein